MADQLIPDEAGSRFYDDPAVFAAYTRTHADHVSSPNHVMETPAVWEELGDVTGLRVLDLACGDARFGRDLLAAGAAAYLGVDGSRRMVQAARATLSGTRGRVEHAQLEDYLPAPGDSDLITCRLAVHYLADLPAWLRSTRVGLRPGGRLLITALHPVITCHDSPGDGRRQTWTVDDYFQPGPRRRRWLGGTVTWFHRTLEDYHQVVREGGFTVDVLRECAPDPTRFSDDSTELDRRRRVPLFLLLQATP